eukprot:7389190-Prymnesium_polylepis.2
MLTGRRHGCRALAHARFCAARRAGRARGQREAGAAGVRPPVHPAHGGDLQRQERDLHDARGGHGRRALHTAAHRRQV